MKVAIVIGHHKNSAGFYSEFLKQSEYIYNSEVASYLNFYDIYNRNGKGTYKQQMQALADELNPKGYDFVIELHFNGFNKKVQGVETVSWKGNKATQKAGEDFCKLISEKYGIKNRGVKHVEENGRGYWFNYYIESNTMILEPFFGDEKSSEKFRDYKEYACDLQRWIEDIEKPSTNQ